MTYCGSSCGRSYSPRSVSPVYRINHVRPDRPFEMYAKAHDIMDMYKKTTGLDLNKSGSSYQRKVGPDPLAGYASGTSNSGNYAAMNSYMSQLAGARDRYDFNRLFG